MGPQASIGSLRRIETSRLGRTPPKVEVKKSKDFTSSDALIRIFPEETSKFIEFSSSVTGIQDPEEPHFTGIICANTGEVDETFLTE